MDGVLLYLYVFGLFSFIQYMHVRVCICAYEGMCVKHHFSHFGYIQE